MIKSTLSRAIYFLLSFTLMSGCGVVGQTEEPIAKDMSENIAAPNIAQNIVIDTSDESGRKIDPAPVPANVPKLVSLKDSISQETPVCTFTIRYPNYIDHEIPWRGNKCSELQTDFLMPNELKKLGMLQKLDQETRFELAEYHKLGVFYIEGEFTASIYPLNVAGNPHEVPVAD